MSNNPLQFAGLGANAAFLTTAAAIGEAMQFSYAGAGFKYDGPTTEGADKMAATKLANDAENEAEKLKGQLDATMQGEVDRLISEIRAAVKGGDIKSIREATQRLRDGLETLRAIQAANNAERSDISQMSMQQINALHRDFYANDAQYRAEMDALMAQSDEQAEDFARRMQPLDDYLQQRGITTPVDDEISELDRRIAEAKAQGNMQEVLRLRQQQAGLYEQKMDWLQTNHPEIPATITGPATSAVGTNRGRTDDNVSDANRALEDAVQNRGVTSGQVNAGNIRSMISQSIPAADAVNGTEQAANTTATVTAQPLSANMDRAISSLAFSGFTPVNGQLSDADYTEPLATRTQNVRSGNDQISATIV